MNIQTLTEHELYLQSKKTLVREMIGKDVGMRSEWLYKESLQRNPIIWEKALEDAQKIAWSIQDVYESYGVYPNDHARIVSINRIDFCNPTELQKTLGVRTNKLESIMRIVDNDYFCSKVRGVSMNGAGINENDILIIEKTNRIKDESIGIIELGKTHLIKRIFYTEDGLMLKSENAKYPTMFVPYGEAEPFGVVRYCIKEIS